VCDYHLLGEHVRDVHAEYPVVPADNLVSVPEGVDWVTAAAVPLVFQTAWRMLITRGELRPGESILVLGASGGVGHAAVQIADYVGAEVCATASSEEKLAYAREVGADHTINYEAENFAEEIRDRTGGRVRTSHPGGPSHERNSARSRDARRAPGLWEGSPKTG
jgi:NADPH2:quinone reductase